MKRIGYILSLVAVTTSCAVKKEIHEAQNNLNGTWELAAANFSTNLNKDFKEGLPTLTFDSSEDLAVYGYDGCNRIRTKADLKKDQQISIDKEIVSTMMACNQVRNLDFQNTLTASKYYELKNNNVLLLKSDSTEMRFHKITLNGSWYLDKIFVGRTKAADLFPHKKPFIRIDINKTTFSGGTACNLLNGQILMFQNTMQFNHISATKMSCEDKNEKVFLDALNRVTHYKLDGTRLVLLEKDKKIMELAQQFEN